MITVQNISKTYSSGKVTVQALQQVNFSVEAGSLYGLIGPDGAGKTSMLRILATLLKPDSGAATIAGLDSTKDYRSLRQKLGYMPGKFSLYPDLTIEENLSFFATIFHTTIKANYSLIQDIYEQIEPFKNRPAGKLSGGMKQKLALCCALIHKPTYLILDEPTTGVDVVSRKEFWQMLQRLKNEGITIVVSTPYMDEALQCDTISLIQHGKIMDTNSPQRLIEKFDTFWLAVKSEKMYQLLHDLRENQNIEHCWLFGECYHIKPNSADQNFEYTLTEWLRQKGHTSPEAYRITPGIEDIFLEQMQYHD